jgi:hypothetical protein
MEGLNKRIKEFLSTDDSTKYGFGASFGGGTITGYGNGYGNASWNGCGDGYGYGYRYRYSDYGSDYEYGNEYGRGYGCGDGIAVFEGKPVHDIDGIQTIITTIHAGFAKGYILNSNLTLTPCFIAKSGDIFAHGETLKKAISALQGKLFKDMTAEERINAFIESYPDEDTKIPARDLWIWHSRLTGSCEMGRNQFVTDHRINLEKDEFTPIEFCEMCKHSYGYSVIQKLEEAYND